MKKVFYILRSVFLAVFLLALNTIGFSQAPNVTVTTPVDLGTTSWQRGTHQTITWTDNLSSNVRVQLYSADGLTLILTIKTSSPGTSCDWYISPTQALTSYKIKVYSLSNPAVYDFSATFSIVAGGGGSLTLTDPTGGESWQRGTTQDITWSRNACNDNVKIELKNPNGTYTTLTNSVDGTSWSWYIDPALVAGNYRIKISSVVDPSINNESAATFAITAGGGGSIVLVSPNGGESWQKGTTQTITWTRTDCPENIKIELNLDGVYTTLTNSVGGNSWSWYIDPALAVDDYKIKISSVVDPGIINDESVATFAITAGGGGSVALVSPNGGESWQKGTTQTITWTRTDCPENVKIELNLAGVYTTLTNSVGGSSWSWYIDPALVAGNYKIKISSILDPSINDESAATFAITAGGGGSIVLVSPNGGESWQRGTNHPITWTKTFSENVKIELNLGGVYSTLTNSTSGTTWNWYIDPALDADEYKIKISSVLDPSISDESFGLFDITAGGNGSVDVTSPESGEYWQRGTTQTITWDKEFSENVKIELCNDAGVVQSVIKSSAANELISWYIAPTTPAGDYKIKVSSILDPSNSSLSAAHFHIVLSMGPNPAVATPNTAVYWARGSTQQVTWTKTFSENVKIELWKGGVFYSVLKNSISGLTFGWYISNAIPVADDYKIKVMSLLDNSYADFSDVEFHIAVFNMSVYPNPAGNTISLDFEHSSTATYDVVMYDRFGTQRMKTSMNTDAAKEHNLSVAELPNGIYYLVLTSGENRITRTVVVQH